jgi:proteasome lid subunit RPN8/RPN11
MQAGAQRRFRELLKAMAAHAQSAYPEECCGLVVRTAAGLEVIRCTNIQNRLHALDPEAHPRDARSAYTIDPAELIRILTRIGSEEAIEMVYHSHPEQEAYFSAEDRKQALALGREPVFPHASYVVLSVRSQSDRQPRIAAARAYRWNGVLQDFIESSPTPFGIGSGTEAPESERSQPAA